MYKRLIPLLMAFGLIAAACGSSGEVASVEAGSSDPVDISSAESEFGTLLVDGDGYTLYTFDVDERGSNVSTCTGPCIEQWPAVEEISVTSSSVSADLIGSFERSDGTIQATYNGWPLYTFAGDDAPGDTNGQGFNQVWWLIDAQGELIS